MVMMMRMTVMVMVIQVMMGKAEAIEKEVDSTMVFGYSMVGNITNATMC